MLIKMAWRNIWRNKRRTIITMASIFFAVMLAVLMRSANTGIYEQMVHNVVSFSSGYIQVHGKGYWQEKSIENSFKIDSALLKAIAETEGISRFAPRLESFALVSTLNKTKGVLVFGIDPESESAITRLNTRVTKGQFIKAGDNGVLMSEGLASSTGTLAGDTVVLLSQGYHGSSAAGKYPVIGIVRFGSPELNKRVIHMPLKLMQQMYGAPDMLTSVSVMLDDNSNTEAIRQALEASVKRDLYEVLDWKQMLPELNQLIEGDLAGDYIVIGILYLVIAFGVFGTVLMMTRERMHEFGILIAIGMKKRLLGTVLALEAFIISFIAAVAGMFAALPVIYWFKSHPIKLGTELQKIYDRYGMEAVIPFSDRPHVFTEQAAIVFSIAIVLSFYTTQRIFSLKTIDALKS